ncbi:hypothetical protein VST7929_02847 [Vibrio stylophorae]|uniref:Uncharacterized protein n=1 Tax=Vibrio stylophorae TaxID=659351 RepID=A0ABN8DY87_9VIBR|nr:hypothetical protein [Vibrio stylophorae]CAH0535186.1 hypothetical protein VST7929_02847 [Vibrio stylophorae]
MQVLIRGLLLLFAMTTAFVVLIFAMVTQVVLSMIVKVTGLFSGQGPSTKNRHSAETTVSSDEHQTIEGEFVEIQRDERHP